VNLLFVCNRIGHSNMINQKIAKVLTIVESVASMRARKGWERETKKRAGKRTRIWPIRSITLKLHLKNSGKIWP
jgi:hypothetical protein